MPREAPQAVVTGRDCHCEEGDAMFRKIGGPGSVWRTLVTPGIGQVEAGCSVPQSPLLCHGAGRAGAVRACRPRAGARGAVREAAWRSSPKAVSRRSLDGGVAASTGIAGKGYLLSKPPPSFLNKPLLILSTTEASVVIL